MSELYSYSLIPPISPVSEMRSPVSILIGHLLALGWSRERMRKLHCEVADRGKGLRQGRRPTWGNGEIGENR